MKGRRQAVERITAWVAKYEQVGLSVYGDKLGSSYQDAPLLLSDIKALLCDATSGRCGMTHRVAFWRYLGLGRERHRRWKVEAAGSTSREHPGEALSLGGFDFPPASGRSPAGDYAGDHCTHWTDAGERCCGCGLAFRTIEAAWDSFCDGPAAARPAAPAKKEQ